MKYIIYWAVVYIFNDTAYLKSYNQNFPFFSSEAECVSFRDTHTERMKDIVRGANNLPFTAEVFTEGTCEAEQKDDPERKATPDDKA